MATPVKSISSPIRMRGVVKLPQVVIEEQGLGKGSKLTVTYGKNYTAVVIMPEGTKLNDRMAERINLLVNEPLG
jgi:hypothetical protein